MQTNKEAEQVTLSDLGICCGKMFQEPSPAELPKARTSVSSSKRSSELSAVPLMSLDLTPGHGNLLGESYWELISPWLGGAWMLNTGVSPNDARGSSLSQILQDAPPIKYYLSPKVCLGILRRASERGKALPPKLERALKIQAGLMRPDGQPTDLNAFHINQRDEGIDLHGVSGALMATTNMQMQTFVTQPDDTVEGFDGYNGDLTGDVAATLGVNCGMSTGRNGVMAFAANQRDEVRDLHDIAGALNAQLGMKQQTFVAAAFSAGAGASAGSIGYGEELAPTLKGSASGNCMPSVLCLNDQGGSVMECSENVSGTLRAQEHGHQPLVYLKQEENFQLMPERVVAAIDDAVSLVYLDNPNNPTGQSVPLDAMRMILDKAREVGACVISDEAYGDYLAPEDSAITLVNEYDNLIVMRSFSKGTGLAGMRAAYVAASPEIIAQIDKVSNPYCINGIGRRLAVAALEDTAFVEESRRRIAAAKQALRSCTGGALSMAATLDSCSICLLTHKDKNCDLAKLFASYGVKVVSGSDFEGLGTNSVRLRLPPQEQEKALLCIVRDIDRGASDRVS